MGVERMRTPLDRVNVYLQLGRVSNLPTVWTNTLTGIVLAGESLRSIQVPVLIVAFTLFYTGGMFLNDACDRDIDRRERPDRPIPAGLITATTVFMMGYGMMLLAIVVVIGVGLGKGWGPGASAVALAIAVISYDAYHKHNPFGPWIMALCRAFIYVTSAAVVSGHINSAVMAGAVALSGYVAGLTYFAKRRSASAGRVAGLIAGISLLDAALMASRGAFGGAGFAVLAFLLTRRWQRSIQGT
jgi:4-hydroxybenzoate polyprenyltransferase